MCLENKGQYILRGVLRLNEIRLDVDAPGWRTASECKTLLRVLKAFGMKRREMWHVLEGRSAAASRIGGMGFCPSKAREWNILEDGLNELEAIRRVQLPSRIGGHPPNARMIIIPVS
jgi:hypothetical protein